MARAYQDPVTGDKLTRSEAISWKIQSIIRRWTFLIVYTSITALVWAFGLHNTTALLWWNLTASYLAIFIENTVGIAMFSQTRRDALIIREIRRYESEDAKAHATELEIEEDDRRMIAEILKRIDILEGRE
jgi:hypothetical protein